MPERLPGVSTASPHPHVAVIERTHRDLDLVFAALPGATVVFAADAPHFTVLAASDTLLAVSNRPREAVVGRPLAEAFPNASPADPEARGLARVRGALEAAVRTGVPQPMPRQRYDLQRPDGQWEERYWDAVNTPVRGADGTVRYVLHQTEDVTARVRGEQAAAEELQVTAAHLAERTAQAGAAAAALADSEARYRLAAEAAEIGTWTWDITTDAMTFDARVRKTFGFADDEPAPRLDVLATRVHPADRERVAAAMAAAADPAGDGRYAAEYRVLLPDGSERWAAAAGLMRFAGDGPARRPVSLLGTAMDITARKQAEVERDRLLAALDAERERLRLLILSMPSPLALHVGPEHRFELINAAFRRISGGGRDDTGLTVRDAFPELSGQGIIEALDRVYATGEPWIGAEIPIRYDRDGTGLQDTWYNVRYEPVRDQDGAVWGVLNFAVDVTDQVRARRRVEELLAESERARADAEAARRDAEEANRAKSEFLATMSHELRTPLNAIAGYTQLLELGIAGPTTAEQRDYLTRVATSGQHLLGLVNDVLDLAKVDAGELTVAHDTATTEPAVTAALDLVRPLGDARGVRVLDGNPERTTAYVGDEHRVRQILVNLLSNAVKFTAAGGTVTVTCGGAAEAPPAVRVHGEGPWAYVRVEDTGVGIVPEAQATVFEPFRQVEPQVPPATADGASGGTRPTIYTRTTGGTGLGLAISRRLARLMGGDLTLESTPAVGSAFTLWLPSPGGAERGEGGAGETAAARGVRAARGTPGVVRGLGELGALLRRQVDALVTAYADRLRVEPAVPLARGMQQAELEDHMVTALADLAQTLVIVGEAGTAETGLLSDSVAINRVVAERHGVRRFAQGWDLAALRRDYAIMREVIARAVRADARAGGADAEAALAILLGFVEQSEVRAVVAWRAARAAGADGTAGGSTGTG